MTAPTLANLTDTVANLSEAYTRTKQRERVLTEQNARYRKALLQIANAHHRHDSSGQFRLSMIAYEALNGPRGEG